MKRIAYFGVRRSALFMKGTFNKKLGEPTAYDQGIAVPTSSESKNAITVPWGDVMVCLKEALAASPEMRADLKAMLEEHALMDAKAYTADAPVEG